LFETKLHLIGVQPGETCKLIDRKLFIGRPCKRRADDLLKLIRHQLKMAVAVLTGHAPVRRHLRIMGLFDGDPTCRFCRMEANNATHMLLQGIGTSAL
jgi:Fe2+ transport system protein FeoA